MTTKLSVWFIVLLASVVVVVWISSCTRPTPAPAPVEDRPSDKQIAADLLYRDVWCGVAYPSWRFDPSQTTTASVLARRVRSSATYEIGLDVLVKSRANKLLPILDRSFMGKTLDCTLEMNYRKQADGTWYLTRMDVGVARLVPIPAKGGKGSKNT